MCTIISWLLVACATLIQNGSKASTEHEYCQTGAYSTGQVASLGKTAMTHMAVALRDPINCAVVITQLVVGAGLSLLLTMHMDKWGAWLHSMSSRQREANAAVKQVSCQSTDSVMCWDHQRQGRVQELDCSDQQLWHKPVVCDENGTKVAVDAKELQGHQLTDSDLQRCHDSHTGCSFNDTAFALQPSVVEEVSIAASEAPLGADTVVQASGNCEETVRVVPLHSTAQSHDRTPLRDETGSSNEDGTTAAELTVHPQVSAQQQSTVVVKALGPTAASEWLQDTMACMTAAGEGEHSGNESRSGKPLFCAAVSDE